MDEEVNMEIIKEIREIRRQAEDKPNIHKIITFALFFAFIIGGGLFFLRTDNVITAYVVQTMTKSNSCHFDTGTLYQVNCRYLTNGAGTITLEITNDISMLEQDIVVKEIRVNGCKGEFDISLSNEKSALFNIPCISSSIKTSNKLYLRYEDKVSKLPQSINGELILVA